MFLYLKGISRNCNLAVSKIMSFVKLYFYYCSFY